MREVAVKGQHLLLAVLKLTQQDAVTDALVGDSGDTRMVLS
jgi:hypothetical protein